MFKNKKSKSKLARIDTLIGKYTHIRGDISFSGGLRVDGSVAGNISATGDDGSVLTLADGSMIEGEVCVSNLLSSGLIIGNVYVSDYAELACQAKIDGNIYYRFLEMAMGSEVNGRLIRIVGKDDILHSKANNKNFLNVEHDVIND